MTRHAHIPSSAVLLIVVASACFTVIDVSVKYLSQRYPVPPLVWARWSVQALLMLALLGPRLRWKLLRSNRPNSANSPSVIVSGGPTRIWFAADPASDPPAG